MEYPHSLPVYSVDTKEEAKNLQILVCKFDSVHNRYVLPNSTPWKYTGFDGTVDSFDKVAAYLDDIYKNHVA